MFASECRCCTDIQATSTQTQAWKTTDFSSHLFLTSCTIPVFHPFCPLSVWVLATQLSPVHEYLPSPKVPGRLGVETSVFAPKYANQGAQLSGYFWNGQVRLPGDERKSRWRDFGLAAGSALQGTGAGWNCPHMVNFPMNGASGVIYVRVTGT